MRVESIIKDVKYLSHFVFFGIYLRRFLEWVAGESVTPPRYVSMFVLGKQKNLTLGATLRKIKIWTINFY